MHSTRYFQPLPSGTLLECEDCGHLTGLYDLRENHARFCPHRDAQYKREDHIIRGEE